MERSIPGAATLLAPGTRLGAVVFGCTSASTIIGPGRVESLVNDRLPGVPVTNPATAAAAALRQIGARRIVVVAPYSEDVTQKALGHFLAEGFEIVNAVCFGINRDDRIAEVPPEAFFDAIDPIRLSDAEAVFISCTATRAISAIELIENRTGCPVVTSNQAAFWHAMRLAGSDALVAGFGSLLRTPPIS